MLKVSYERGIIDLDFNKLNFKQLIGDVNNGSSETTCE